MQCEKEHGSKFPRMDATVLLGCCCYSVWWQSLAIVELAGVWRCICRWLALPPPLLPSGSLGEANMQYQLLWRQCLCEGL